MHEYVAALIRVDQPRNGAQLADAEEHGQEREAVLDHHCHGVAVADPVAICEGSSDAVGAFVECCPVDALAIRGERRPVPELACVAFKEAADRAPLCSIDLLLARSANQRRGHVQQFTGSGHFVLLPEWARGILWLLGTRAPLFVRCFLGYDSRQSNALA